MSFARLWRDGAETAGFVGYIGYQFDWLENCGSFDIGDGQQAFIKTSDMSEEGILGYNGHKSAWVTDDGVRSGATPGYGCDERWSRLVRSVSSWARGEPAIQ